MGNRPETWQTTQLWAAIESRGDDTASAVKMVVSGVLPKVEIILASGDTTPSDFTLHDADHSWRVAERIAEIAGASLIEEMGPYELALLLLSAYLHDIGMTPPLGKVTAHFTYLLSGEVGNLTNDDVKQLQIFLDDNEDGQVPPLRAQAATAADIATAGQIISAYVRDRHNDWSELWMREHLANFADNLYPRWLDDLVLLCRSHHYGIDQLRHSDFTPRLRGAPVSVVHLRYCACLLRVADVMDFDPERTPSVLFAHRNVKDGSLIYWHKDHGIAFDIGDGQISLHAQPPDAVTHRAVLCTADDVERELLLCDRLAEETQIQRMAGRREDLPHRWPLSAHVRRFVDIPEDSYEYVDGTFRPDPKRVLDLIGGVELYGSKLVAVRELLQNSFDAVREQLARERLRQADRGSEQSLTELARTHAVSLRLERDGEEVRLTCTDTGSGMSKDILVSRFLIGGKGANHDIRDLERQCEERGFSVGRTARFGIGVLSYFLLASRLELQTRRSAIAGDPDSTGWSFSSNGLEDFGELRKNSGWSQGTEITLTLRSEFLGESFMNFIQELRDYLDYTVQRVPCQFSFTVTDDEIDPIKIEPGWSDREANAREQMLYGLGDDDRFGHQVPTKLLSARKQEEKRMLDESNKELRHRADERLVVICEEGELEGELGVYRIHTGYFLIEQHPSVVYLELKPSEDGVHQLCRVGRHEGFLPSSRVLTSWNGMEIESEQEDDDQETAGVNFGNPYESSNALVEIDWTSDAAGKLAVDRNSLKLSEAGVEATKFVEERARNRLRDLVKETGPSPLSLFNTRILGMAPTEDDPLCWIQSDTEHEPGQYRLQPIQFPAQSPVSTDFPNSAHHYQWQGNQVALIKPLSVGGSMQPTLTFYWHGNLFVPTRLVVASIGAFPQPVVLWGKRSRRGTSTPLFLGDFPPSYEAMVGFGGQSASIWNQAHPLIRVIDKEAWDWAGTMTSSNDDPIDFADEILASPARVAAWVVQYVRSSSEDLWNGLIDRVPDLVNEAWRRLDGLDEDSEIFFVDERMHRRTLLVVSRLSWERRTRASAREWMQEAATDLPEEWKLTLPTV